MKLKFICTLVLILLLPLTTYGRSPVFDMTDGDVHIGDFTIKELQKLYDDIEYDEYVVIGGDAYPRVFIKNIPFDYKELEDQTYRNRVFIKMLAPLVFKVNQEFLEDREDLLAMEYSFDVKQDFDDWEIQYIELLAKKYDVTTPFQGTRRSLRLLQELLLRADAVPPSILIAAAAIYSNWGTSRLATEANNLYKAREWYTDKGLKSVDEPDEPYRYKIYPSLEASIRDYVLRLNSNINYEQFWDARHISRRRGSKLYGERLDWALVLDNNLRNYAGLLDYTLTYYKLYNIDASELEDKYDFED